MKVPVADFHDRATRMVFISLAGYVATPHLWGFCDVGMGGAPPASAARPGSVS